MNTRAAIFVSALTLSLCQLCATTLQALNGLLWLEVNNDFFE